MQGRQLLYVRELYLVTEPFSLQVYNWFEVYNFSRHDLKNSWKLPRGKTLLPNRCPAYDTKQSDGEVPVMLGLWGMQSTPSLLLLPGPPRPGMVAPDRGLSMG